ncbi:trypsin-like serine protease [Corynebacterium mastitidis]|uniref:trypsin-like serine protease n=1 Tax=Corynebacterium mastitidis TaxID=161890 RepID=UPI0003699335|nr:trypsin-like serine protease [Corynebacterium mastitidis]
MKIARVLLGAALCATIAAPAHAATTLHQGMAISATEGYQCTLSIADRATAYTALHCGDGAWRVGDTVRTLDGRPVGRITALGSETSPVLDVVEIALDAGTVVSGHVGRGDSAAMRTGDRVQFRAPGNYATGTITESTPRRFIVRDGRFPSIMINSNVPTYYGNSGGPLMDPKDNLLGVLSASNQKDDSLFTPLYLIERGFGS